jgi:hypothetical protein
MGLIDTKALLERAEVFSNEYGDYSDQFPPSQMNAVGAAGIGTFNTPWSSNLL